MEIKVQVKNELLNYFSINRSNIDINFQTILGEFDQFIAFLNEELNNLVEKDDKRRYII